jgi:hypothetical protein
MVFFGKEIPVNTRNSLVLHEIAHVHAKLKKYILIIYILILISVFFFRNNVIQ